MPRVLRPELTAEATKQETALLTAYVAEISHADLADPILMTNNAQDIQMLTGIGGASQTYTAVGFTITLPEEKDDQFTQAQIVISNADQWFTPTLRALSGGFVVTLRLASLADESQTPPLFTEEMSWLPFDLIGVQYDAQKVSGSLSYESFSGNQFPWGTFNPNDFPGIVS